jgi:hypothetical protein
VRCKNLKGNLAFPNQIELIRRTSFAKKMETLLKSNIRSTARQQLDIVWFETLVERMFGDDPSQVPHRQPLLIEVRVAAQPWPCGTELWEQRARTVHSVGLNPYILRSVQLCPVSQAFVTWPAPAIGNSVVDVATTFYTGLGPNVCTCSVKLRTTSANLGLQPQTPIPAESALLPGQSRPASSVWRRPAAQSSGSPLL